MKAIICTKHGPPEVLQLQDVEKPVPGDNEVLVKVHAATVTTGDVMLRKLHPLMVLPMRLFGVRRKRIPGHEFAGEIEQVGARVKKFKAGDQVFGTTTGLSVGANAEFVCIPEEWETGVFAIKPSNVTYQEAAAIPVGGMTALQILRRANIQSGRKVLIYGASGSVGTYAVQIAKTFGADVTGVCSTKNVELVKSLGADKVIDYTKEDFTESGETYDVIFDAVGKSSPEQNKKSLKPEGQRLSIQTSTKETIELLLFLKKLVEAGDVKPVIDRSYPLEQTADAHRMWKRDTRLGMLSSLLGSNMANNVRNSDLKKKEKLQGAGYESYLMDKIRGAGCTPTWRGG
ncbi:MAG: NAD(P)-dependent alcohol dehydrogenase [Flavobacteriales bacterium]|nr:NAD(P)-dependent alcohol dehydrogenase [Flavobacteriales bacterium]